MQKKELSRRKKVALAALISASVGAAAAVILTQDEEESDEEKDIFEDVENANELRRIWNEYNRENHPDKIQLKGDEFISHMEKYHKIKHRYEYLRDHRFNQ